ncbi:hypothetical protein EDEG_01771 [Edhazardia aedis USNM 41457]|uniref:Uncharacterized protein n=1 Tax=Edhazardia aedis (strain USNM 41457) TaxID=1003232 RepID=J8ZW66_EDHAE|nr:hypothetical protein EDEG_01771 [Edhazardia aedis USNM 41457]|eukprot:EJW03933.1 hypothetical protein EDEG_01771 [Edhazardia aedis USNM 41457]
MILFLNCVLKTIFFLFFNFVEFTIIKNNIVQLFLFARTYYLFSSKYHKNIKNIEYKKNFTICIPLDSKLRNDHNICKSETKLNGKKRFKNVLTKKLNNYM